ncbi:MAG: serine/threonine protein kinase [Chloroflexota bacterium]|nr:serine/threonine protein kinase [Chloroflexota bacterium]
MADRSWGFKEGDEIVPGRHAIHLLGGGQRSEAYLAWDDRLHALIVAKVLRPTELDDEAAHRGLRREALALARLQHPSIVRCFDAVPDGPRPHLVLESLDGPRLSTLIRRFGPLAPEQLVPLGLELCSALAFMHDSGYLHLDLKPRNTIMGAAPRLIDLGLARTFEEVRELTSPLGTDEYMAPEQTDGATVTSMDAKTDVWGLGVTLYMAANGRLPFPVPRSSEVGYPQRTADPEPFSPRVPQEIEAPIRACLARDPVQRPTAAEMAEWLEALLPSARRVARRRIRARVR